MFAFDNQPTLIGPTLRLRPLTAEDGDALYDAAKDPETWAGHPAFDRYKPEVFRPYFDFLLQSGGTLAVTLKDGGRVIGCSRYYVAENAPDDVSIGFTFLDRLYWGGGTNREMKRLMLDHAFRHFERVWFHIAPTNLRSQIATGRLGATDRGRAVLNLSGTPTEVMCFCIERDHAHV